MELNLWQPLAGLGLFLFAMRFIEQALGNLSADRLQGILRRHTARPVGGVVVGTLTTAVLQSSSLVGLMTLALVGAGILRLRHALGVIFGSNLGTTATGWIVASIGFKFDLDAVALPLVACGGLAAGLFDAGRRRAAGRLILGIGLLLLALGYLKGLVDNPEGLVSAETLGSFGAVEYFLFGIVATMVIQSSSAAMAITLTALYGGVIDLPSAAAIVIGADLGTTSTVLLGALNGAAIKKRVAAGHFLFNLGTDITALLIRVPLLGLITATALAADPLLSLVAFHSAFNLLGVCIFLPLQGRFADFLERLIPDRSERHSAFLNPESAALPEAAVDAMRSESQRILERAIRQNGLLFDPPLLLGEPTPGAAVGADFAVAYDETQALEGELLEYFTAVSTAELAPHTAHELRRYQGIARDAVHGCKQLKDSRLPDSHAMAAAARGSTQALYRTFLELLREEKHWSMELTAELAAAIHQTHEEIHANVLATISSGSGAANAADTDPDASTLLNLNRNLRDGHRAILAAVVVFCAPAPHDEAAVQLIDEVA